MTLILIGLAKNVRKFVIKRRKRKSIRQIRSSSIHRYMPLKNKNRRARELVASLGRESMKMIRDELIQGNYVIMYDLCLFLLLNDNKYVTLYKRCM